MTKPVFDSESTDVLDKSLELIKPGKERIIFFSIL